MIHSLFLEVRRSSIHSSRLPMFADQIMLIVVLTLESLGLRIITDQLIWNKLFLLLSFLLRLFAAGVNMSVSILLLYYIIVAHYYQ